MSALGFLFTYFLLFVSRLNQNSSLSTGVPKLPLVPTLYSYNTSSITLTLFTAFTGLLPGGEEEVTFRLRINETDVNISQIRFQEATFPADISGESVQVTVANVDPTKFYMFSVRAENRFGVSAFSKDSDRISTTKDDGGNITVHSLKSKLKCISAMFLCRV